LQPGELCDDRGATGGCANDCQSLPAGWSCPVVGQPCELCGDGVINAHERCDDRNTNSGDGCRNDC
jgi:cysteine-rich repeat protein